jgi:hypothetical protein
MLLRKGKSDSVYNCYPQTILWKNRSDRLGAPTAGGGREGLAPGISEKNR